MNALMVLFFLTYLVYSLKYDWMFYMIYITLVATYTYVTQYLLLKTPFDHMRNKVTVGSWSSPSDPQLYGKIKLNVTKIEDYLVKKSKEVGKKLTYTIYSIKLLSLVINKFPTLNTYIKYGSIRDKLAVDLCCLVTLGDGNDLANSVIRDSEKKSIVEINDELQDSVDKLRSKKNKDHNQKGKIAQMIPSFLLAPLVQITSYLSSIGIGIKALGVSCIINMIIS